MRELQVRVRPVATLDQHEIRSMFELFRANYADVDFERFTRDLTWKDTVFMIDDQFGAMVGFSTLVARDFDLGQKPVRVVFSGDTIIDRNHWGSQAFAFAWIREIARIKSSAPDKPLYWLLISKGYRTYRYLDAFVLAFTPDWRGTVHSELDSMRDALAARLFGDHFNPQSGIVSWPEPRGRLASELVVLSERELQRADVRFFVDRNPGFAGGDELVCFCALEEDNMKPLTRRIFREGLRQCTVGIS